MKNTFLISLAILSINFNACKQQVGQKPVTKVTINYARVDTMHRPVLRDSFDSGRYSIIRRWYPSGQLMINYIENKDTKLQETTDYYDNGHLEKTGTLTAYSPVLIGPWYYYSATGKLDSCINYDNTYPVNYYKALAIAKKHGFNLADIDIALTSDSINHQPMAYWTISPYDSAAEQGMGLQINAQTGKTHKIYCVSVKDFSN